MKSSVQHGRLRRKAISATRLTKQRLIYEDRIKIEGKYRCLDIAFPGVVGWRIGRKACDRGHQL